MSFIETILGYKLVKDIAKKLITWDNAKWLVRQYNKYIVDRAQHFQGYKVKMQTKFETVSKSGLGNNALKLHEVCEEILQSLYTMLDLSKGGEYEHQKKCKLSLTDYKRVLGYIAFYCLKNKQLITSNIAYIGSQDKQTTYYNA